MTTQWTTTDPVLNDPQPVEVAGRYFRFQEVTRRQAEHYATVAQQIAQDIGKRHNVRLSQLNGEVMAGILAKDLQYLVQQFHGFLDNLVHACCQEWDGKQYQRLPDGMLEDVPYSFYLRLVTNALLAQKAPIDAFTGGLAEISSAFKVDLGAWARPEPTTPLDAAVQQEVISIRRDSSPASPKGDSDLVT